MQRLEYGSKHKIQNIAALSGIVKRTVIGVHQSASYCFWIHSRVCTAFSGVVFSRVAWI